MIVNNQEKKENYYKMDIYIGTQKYFYRKNINSILMKS